MSDSRSQRPPRGSTSGRGAPAASPPQEAPLATTADSDSGPVTASDDGAPDVTNGTPSGAEHATAHGEIPNASDPTASADALSDSSGTPEPVAVTETSPIAVSLTSAVDILGQHTRPQGEPSETRRSKRLSMTEKFHLVLDKVAPEDRAPVRNSVLRVLYRVISSWIHDRPFQQASSLAFQTSLSMVPLLAAALALMSGAGALEEQSTLVKFLAERVLPMSAETIADQLMGWAEQLSMKSAGFAGLAVTLILSFILYDSVESIFNDIWRVEVRRRLSQRFLVFYTLITLIPSFLGFSIYQAASYGLTQGGPGFMVGLAATWAALFFANWLLPHVRVKWTAAAVGALASALLFEAAKHLFNFYVTQVAFDRYSGVYGALALVPIFLVWVYYTWVVVLFGASIAHALQNLQALERHAPGQRGEEPHVNGMIAARLLCEVIHRWRTIQSPTPRLHLMRVFGLREEVVELIFRRLKVHKLALEVEGENEGYLPARPPAEITLGDVLQPFRDVDVSVRTSNDKTPLDLALHRIEQAIREESVAVTLDRLA